jgi:hypothetical protein
MAFVLASTTASAAVATNGTFTVAAPTATLAGAIKNRGGHVMSIHAMGAIFNYPNDFSISWSGATATITYLGTTTIPAGSKVDFQFELDGDDTNFPYHNLNGNQVDKTGAYRGSFGQVFKVDFGAPLVANTTLVLATTAVLVTTLVPLAAPVVFDVPRNAQVVSSTTDTTQTITLRGLDEYGVALTETLTLNGTTPVLGLKAFKQINSYQASLALAGNLSIGSGAKLGLPYYLPPQTGTGIGNILKESQDGATPTAGTAVGGVQTKATATTGDVRGTITPNVTPDGTKVYSVYMFVADPSFLGVPQYGA